MARDVTEANLTANAVLVPAVFAGLVAIMVTVAIERWGGRVGGLLGTLPTTIVPAAAGMAGSSASHDAFEAAMAMAPAGMLLNAMFLLTWRVVPRMLPDWPLRRRLIAMVAISLGLWVLGALATVAAADTIRHAGVSLMAAGWLLTAAVALVGVLACRNAPPALSGSRRVGAATLIARGALAATAIGLAVWLAAVGGPFLAGVVAVFPAIFVTTMVSLWLSQGEAVPAGAVGPMMLGSTSVAVYALLSVRTLPAYGPVAGSVAAWLAAVLLVTIPAWLWLQRRMRPVQ